MDNSELPRRRDREQKKVPQKAPLPYRIIAWTCLIMILFGLGYYGSGLIVRIFGKKLNVQQTISMEEQVQQFGGVDDFGTHIAEVKLFLPDHGSLSMVGYRIVPSIPEENITSSVEKWLSLMAAKGFVEGGSRVLHVFRNGEILYLDMNAPFYSSLQKLDRERALLFMTALLRTVIDNFDPIKEVKFLMEGKDALMTDPVDLSVTWRLAPKF